MHVFLSPHPDDAALSCGGLMHELRLANQTVGVFTVMAGDAPAPLPDGHLIQRIHQRWGLGDNPLPGRRHEDHAALQQLGVDFIQFGDWLDCIYRTDRCGNVLYPSDDHLFGDIHPADPLLEASLDLSRWGPITHLYIPLGAGNHIDHRLLRDKVPQTKTVAIFYYEEYPYSSGAEAVYHAHDGKEERLSGTTAVRVAVESLSYRVIPEVHAVSEVALHAKIEAIRSYRSQISTFWDSTTQMSHSVRTYAQQVGNSAGVSYGERLWRRRE